MTFSHSIFDLPARLSEPKVAFPFYALILVMGGILRLWSPVGIVVMCVAGSVLVALTIVCAVLRFAGDEQEDEG
ncbi:hypothetical protein SAMN04488117_1326 [Celeribacter baekdonensis]|uniref:Uncharacterized protein n=1 Tax=Celeribacter baekdonensis TaxID=875171 RepID=A0A1G7UZR0_9RHOB|nr:hypothetical protein [Celeribacter baekdonensis]SDG53105.1 hypothetical protein SAMN04488117_1326 [Celeribacter baekdonensis]